MYLAIATRPDISYVVGVLSRYLDRPAPQHIKTLKRVFRYLKATQNIVTPITLAMSDTRRSTSGYIFLLGDSPIAWGSRRQRCTALSSTEAEYVAASEAVKETHVDKSFNKRYPTRVRCASNALYRQQL
ncbi:uncharacterized protein LOC129953472 [Eupeodes corollae]|uniref:uncharacterized protein LOC129953472 n=1 Tax=Eupeodes corollae TaxID=290404 RepID=UPI00249385F5|nr:uncharacterized protein LOC129953472 [Eupeodes corollae]